CCNWQALAKASDRPHRLEGAGVNGISSFRPENRRAGLHCLGAAGKARGQAMAAPTQSIIDTRRHQMFPVLEPAEIERVRRFGKVRSYGVGEALAKVGEVGLGLTIILGGSVEITQHDQSGRRTAIVTHEPGAFMGELAQLAGRPALVDAHAKEPVEALIIPPDQLRALLIAEAELGERIML